MNMNAYKKLVELDGRLGTTSSEQLFECLRKTTRLDIIKVRIHLLNVDFKLFQSLDFEQVNEYKLLQNKGWAGFAEIYLDRCNKESDADVKANIAFYTELAELDGRLGTTVTEQLYGCLRQTTRWDIIKV